MPTALPQTDALAERILTLPLFAHMRIEDVELVVESLGVAIAAAPRPTPSDRAA